MYIPVIFEDSNIVVIDKPSGVVVHPFDFSTEETMVDFLHEKYPEMFSIENTVTLQDGRTVSLGGIVHKLDRDTSGVMVLARNKETFEALKKQFSEHSTKKVYVALVEGLMEKEEFRINAPLGRGKKDYKQSTNPINPRGELREAITDVKVIVKKENTTLVELTPLTGRTHQLRAHMSSIGHPIVDDIAYGSTTKDSRIMLHAQSLCFTLGNETKTYTAELPKEFN
ncbi:MAG: RluA family pseudouridine synthase [Candidatus Paceibacterota bacterium]